MDMLMGPRGVAVASLVAVLFSAGRLAAAPTTPFIQFNDLSDQITVTSSPGLGSLFSSGVNSDGSEFAVFALSSTIPAVQGEVRLTEGSCASASCPISDFLSLVSVGRAFLLRSDSEVPLFTLPCNPSSCIPETGGLQDVTSFFSSFGSALSFSVLVQSDLDPTTVPVPGTVFLLASGLAMLAGLAWTGRT